MKKPESLKEKTEKLLEWGGITKNVIFLAISGAFLLLSLFLPDNLTSKLPFDPAWVAIILCGIPILIEALTGLITEFDIKADVLVAIALVASVVIHEIFAAGEVAFIMQLGELLEDITVERARSGIEKLVKLTPRTARRISSAGEETIDASAVEIGDILRVLPGETIPADGTIIFGRTSIDSSVITGESLPVDKSEGDKVEGGTINRFGAFDMRADKVGEDSAIVRMIRLVQSADAGKAKIVGIADRWATWIVVIALTASVISYIITRDIIRSVTVLVVFCPCSLVLATPTAIMAAIGNCTKHGFLVREGDALERLADVSVVTFDKTGTLTEGKPGVAAVCATKNFTSDEIYRLTAAVEKKSEHPLAQAVLRGYESQSSADGELPETEEFEILPGRGVRAVTAGRTVLAGNVRLMEENGIETVGASHDAAEYLSRGCTLIHTAIDGVYAGFIALADTIRDSASDSIASIGTVGVTPVLLTGDNAGAAAYTAKALGIGEYRAECLPEDKMEYISSSDEKGNKVCMIGDGVNDAPALKSAYVGIAMGGVGSDIAVEAADIVLTNDSIGELPHLLSLSHKMMITIKINITFSMTLNFVSIVLAVTGILNPIVGALVHNCGSVLVISNSALLLGYGNRK